MKKYRSDFPWQFTRLFEAFGRINTPVKNSAKVRNQTQIYGNVCFTLFLYGQLKITWRIVFLCLCHNKNN